MVDVERSFAALRGGLVAHAMSRLGDAHEAQDVAQDTMLALYEVRDRFEDEAHLEAYAHATVRNLCHNRRRDAGRRAVPSDELPERAGDCTTEQVVLDREVVTAVIDALRDLPPRYAHVLRESARLGSSDYGLLAAATGETVTGVRNVLNRARTTLRARAAAAGYSVGGLAIPGMAPVRAWLRGKRHLVPKTPRGRTVVAASTALPLLLLPLMQHTPHAGQEERDQPSTTRSIDLRAGGPALALRPPQVLDREAELARQFAEDSQKLLSTKPEQLPAPACTYVAQGHGVCSNASGEGSYTYLVPDYYPENEVIENWIYVGRVDCETYADDTLTRCGPAPAG